jgi:hypothetical protein
MTARAMPGIHPNRISFLRRRRLSAREGSRMAVTPGLQSHITARSRREEARGGKTRYHRVADVLLAYHATIEQPEARYEGHHQHQGYRRQHPAVSPELGEQFSSVLGSQAGVGTSAGAAAAGSAGAAAGACAYDEWIAGKLKKTPSKTATMNATNPTRKGSLRVTVFVLLVRFTAPRRRFRRCGCAPPAQGRKQRSCRLRFGPSWRPP